MAANPTSSIESGFGRDGAHTIFAFFPRRFEGRDNIVPGRDGLWAGTIFAYKGSPFQLG
jgi:hypothetical protein